MTRISKNTLAELEDYAFAHDLTVSQVSRRAIHQFLLADIPTERVERETAEAP